MLIYQSPGDEAGEKFLRNVPHIYHLTTFQRYKATETKVQVGHDTAKACDSRYRQPKNKNQQINDLTLANTLYWHQIDTHKISFNYLYRFLRYGGWGTPPMALVVELAIKWFLTVNNSKYIAYTLLFSLFPINIYPLEGKYTLSGSCDN